MNELQAIKSIDKGSVHKITSGQVVIDLQTAVKELVENSLDAGATSIEVRFKHYGLRSVEVIDNGTGIAEEYHDNIALKHYTSKLSSFDDLSTIRTFGFRGEALSSLCALSESVTVATATNPPLGNHLEMATSGKVQKRSKVARQRGTTVTVSNLFLPLPVRRKELERNIKREFGKALTLLNAYALGPCCNTGNGVKLTVSNHPDKGQKTVQLQTAGASSSRSAVSALWGSKALENIVDLDISFEVERERTALKRLKSLSADEPESTPVAVKGLISKFAVSAGRNGTDRQFFYVNGRPCNLPKIQKAFNEVYRSFNANQSPFILADFVIPTDSCDINVSPDKRTIFLQSENNLISALKARLEDAFSPSRSTFDVSQKQTQGTQSILSLASKPAASSTPDDNDNDDSRPTSETASSDPPPTRPSKSPNTLDNMPSSPTVVAPASLLPGLRVPAKKAASATSSSSPPSKAAPPAKDKQPLFLDDPEDEPAFADVDTGGNPDPEDEEDDEETTPVLDTSQASWNRALSADARGHVAPAAPSLRESVVMVEEDELEAAGGAEEPGRQIKTKPAVVPERLDDEDEEEDAETLQPPPPSLPSIAILEPPRRPPTSTTSTASAATLRREAARSAGAAAASSKRTIPTAVPKHANIAPNQVQRKLTDFAGPGRRPPARAPVEESEDELDEDQEEQEEAREGRKASSPEVVEDPSAQASETMEVDNAEASSSAAPGVTDLTTDDADDDIDDSDITPIFDPERDTSSSLRAEEPIARPEVIRKQSARDEDVTLRFDLAKVKASWSKLQLSSPGDDVDGGASAPKFPVAAGLANVEDDAQAVDALSRVIEKQDFAKMYILGQFNLGFIIARRRKEVDQGSESQAAMDDLFIVDQHAADEKYNFETLQATTEIKSQKLFKPQPLELTASDELVAVENMDILRRNGFEVEVEEHDGDYVAGGRLKLVAQPISKSTVFNMKDLEELINLMRDQPSGQMVRCSKARAMFAMRACRKSVMVGMPLKKHQMAQVVQHMGTMDLPWNCPHGRPTMRHLFDLTTLSSSRRTSINWTNI